MFLLRASTRFLVHCCQLGHEVSSFVPFIPYHGTSGFLSGVSSPLTNIVFNLDRICYITTCR
jgi:hypothetical protein